MNYNEFCAAKQDDPNAACPPPMSSVAASLLLGCCGTGSSTQDTMKLVSSLNSRDQVDVAIDQWAEALVAIIAASDNPEASLLRAHVAIATRHKELETLAWTELENRGQPSEAAHE